MYSFVLDVAVVAAVFAVLSVSLNLQAGVSGLPNFGIVLFFGIGAYGAGLATTADLPWVVGLVGAILVAALWGIGFGKLARTLTTGTYWGIATLAIAEAVRVIIINQDSVFNGPQGIGGISLPFASLGEDMRLAASLALMLVVLAICWLIANRLIGTQHGRALRLQREQPDLAASLGHNLDRARTSVLILSGAMAAIAGFFYAHYIAFAGTSEMEMGMTFLVWTMVVVGGLGSNAGAVLGAVLIQTLYSSTRFLGDAFDMSADRTASLRILLISVALLVFLLVKNDGLIPEKLRRLRA